MSMCPEMPPSPPPPKKKHPSLHQWPNCLSASSYACGTSLSGPWFHCTRNKFLSCLIAWSSEKQEILVLCAASCPVVI